MPVVELSVQVIGTVRTLEAVSAFDLLIGHRQLDLDALPLGESPPRKPSPPWAPVQPCQLVAAEPARRTRPLSSRPR
jgi:hypothetical protein